VPLPEKPEAIVDFHEKLGAARSSTSSTPEGVNHVDSRTACNSTRCLSREEEGVGGPGGQSEVLFRVE